MDRYKGKVTQWVVVNETIYQGRFNTTFWYRTLGPQHIDVAFQWAREADPNAKLLLNNDHNEELNENSDFLYGLVRDLKSRRVPIDGVGLQMHLDGSNPPNPDRVFANVRRFIDLGIDVYVTEFDADMSNVPGTQSERWNRQAEIYSTILQAYLAAGGRNFSVFGFSDKYSWYKDQGKPLAEATPFDVSFRPKPAYYAMVDVLKQAAQVR